MEVVRVRSYKPYFGAVVYAFALILCTYPLATFVGSIFYRGRWRGRDSGPVNQTVSGH